MRYVVLYPQTKNVHLIKDVGMIAYKLHQLFGYAASVACYDNDTYSYLADEVPGLQLEFITPKYHNDLLDGVRYLKRNAPGIDALQLFHITLRSVVYAFAYKFYHRDGKLFLKLDCTDRLIAVIRKLKGWQKWLLNAFLNKVEVIGVEQSRLLHELQGVLPRQSQKLRFIPNGVDFARFATIKHKLRPDFHCRQNVVLNVARLGSPEKGTDVLLQAFARIKGIEHAGWQLWLVGEIEPGFQAYLARFLADNPQLKGVVQVLGPVYDRDKLFSLYQTAKIFCLSSRFESFGLALLEAAALGDVIVSTDVGIARELTAAGNGIVVGVEQPSALATALEQLIKSPRLPEYSERTVQICRERYDWDKIVSNLDSLLRGEQR